MTRQRKKWSTRTLCWLTCVLLYSSLFCRVDAEGGRWWCGPAAAALGWRWPVRQRSHSLCAQERRTMMSARSSSMQIPQVRRARPSLLVLERLQQPQKTLVRARAQRKHEQAVDLLGFSFRLSLYLTFFCSWTWPLSTSAIWRASRPAWAGHIRGPHDFCRFYSH